MAMHVPETTVAMLDTGVLDVIGGAGVGRLPAVPMSSHNADDVVHTKGTIGQGLVPKLAHAS